MPTEFRLDCPTCARPRLFEQPPCQDDHGPDCPELVCLVCGTALLHGPLPRVGQPSGAGQGSHRHHVTGRRAA